MKGIVLKNNWYAGLHGQVHWECKSPVNLISTDVLCFEEYNYFSKKYDIKVSLEIDYI